MKLEHLINSNLGTIEEEFSSQLSNCTTFSIATSFIGDHTIDLLENCLKKNNKLQSGRLLIGVYQFFNRKKDLERLNKLAQQYSNKFQVQISKNKKFHWKYYHFTDSRKSNIYVGSANFTHSGLHVNGELVVKLSDNINSRTPGFQKLVAAFDKELLQSGPISQFKIQYYKESVQSKNLDSDGALHPELEKFFKNVESTQNSKPVSEKAVVTFLTQSLKASTVKALLNYNPHWESNNSDYFVCKDKRHFDQCCDLQNLLIISKESGVYSAFWTHVIGSCDTIKKDGCNYFILFKFSKNLKETTLKKDDIDRLKNEFNIALTARTVPFYNKIVTKGQVEKLKAFIKG